MSKFLVTGGAGFIGSNMVDFLVDNNHTVTVVDNLSTGKIENINPNVKFYDLDLSKNKIDSLIEDVDYVIHMAAIPNVQQSIDNPEFTNRHNFITTLNLLESIRKSKSKPKIVFSSTCAIYGNTEKLPVTELDKTSPMSPYALQKLMSEEYIKLYSELYEIKGVCLRYFNVFGERMTNDGAYKSVVSIFKEQYKNNQSLTITNDGNQKRDFVYVKDVVRANYLSLINDTGNFDVFNVGFENSISVNEIASMFGGEKIFIGKRIEPKEIKSDTTKIKNILKWEPTISLNKWLKNNL